MAARNGAAHPMEVGVHVDNDGSVAAQQWSSAELPQGPAHQSMQYGPVLTAWGGTRMMSQTEFKGCCDNVMRIYRQPGKQQPAFWGTHSFPCCWSARYSLCVGGVCMKLGCCLWSMDVTVPGVDNVRYQERGTFCGLCCPCNQPYVDVLDSKGHALGTVRRPDCCVNCCAWWRYLCGGRVVDWVAEVPKGQAKYEFSHEYPCCCSSMCFGPWCCCPFGLLGTCKCHGKFVLRWDIRELDGGNVLPVTQEGRHYCCGIVQGYETSVNVSSRPQLPVADSLTIDAMATMHDMTIWPFVWRRCCCGECCCSDVKSRIK